jgi:DEAD/DEAH box helicase domain-containing protein
VAAVAVVEDASARTDPCGPDAVFDPGEDSELVFTRTLPERAARSGSLARPLPGPVAERLEGLGLWSHQAQAIDLARAGRSVVVATGTASGKSLCYQVPVAEAAGTPVRSGTSLLVFPTKALAHDQLRALTAWGFPGVAAGTYDGDAGPEERAWVRRKANVVLTNPEMLHSGLLPNHSRWATLLSRLQYVVVDELHVFRGIFGSHLAHVLRRLRRLARRYGADPTFVFCSATIGQPAELASALSGLPVEAVLDDGSPSGAKTVAIWSPQRSPDAWASGRGGQGSCHEMTARMMSELVVSGRRTLVFCRSRRATELVAADVRGRLPESLADQVRPYRGGFLPDERREVEELLFGGQLTGVVTTSALELGVDIAGVDAVVLDGFPGTVASFWQQAGRSGRTGQHSSAVLVAGDDQLDQWFAAHPAELLTRPPEPAVVNPANPSVADVHLRCAAHELPLSHEDERYWPGLLDDVVRRLVLDDELEVRTRLGRGTRRSPRAIYSGGGWPSHGVSLRAGSGAEVRVRSLDGEPVGTVEMARACEQVHPGAVYLHAGRTWRVVELDLEARVAYVEPDDGSTYTVARTALEIRVLSRDRSRQFGEEALLEIGLGEVEVHQQVTGYQCKDVRTRRIVGGEDLDLPPSVLRTRAFWYAVDPALLERAGVPPEAVGGALHAVEHAAIGVLPLFAICDRWDVGGVSTPHQVDLGRPAILIYDGYEGGAGVAELGYEAADRHLATTREVIDSCPCPAGCPSCVQSPKCGNGNTPLDKPAALSLLSELSELSEIAAVRHAYGAELPQDAGPHGPRR